MRESGIDFKSKSLTLEGVIASPNGLSGALPGVVVCHPHPLFGGDMNNDLVLAVCKSLVQEGFVTLRFNFRGVGTSDGAFSKGDKEREDVAAALNMLRAWPAVDNARLALVGYSFGAAMILKGIRSYKAARAFALISPPLAALDVPGTSQDSRPNLFMVGDRDRLVPSTALKEKLDSLQRSVDLKVVVGADQSWRGHEAEAANETAKFLVSHLGK